MNVPGRAVRRDDRLTELFRAESAHAVNLAYLLTGERPLAEDIAQEAFVRIAGRLRDVSPEAFPAYLQRTVVNLVRSHYRHADVRRRHADRIRAAAEQQLLPSTPAVHEGNGALAAFVGGRAIVGVTADGVLTAFGYEVGG